MSRRLALWRTWSLSILNTKIGMISAITAMGYGTWVEVKPHAAAPPKLEAEKELEEEERREAMRRRVEQV